MTVENCHAVCEGCGRELSVLESMRWSVCLDCTKARARTACNHNRCTCGKKRVPGEVLSSGSRRWIPCVRCLGTIKQIS